MIYFTIFQKKKSISNITFVRYHLCKYFLILLIQFFFMKYVYLCPFSNQKWKLFPKNYITHKQICVGESGHTRIKNEYSVVLGLGFGLKTLLYTTCVLYIEGTSPYNLTSLL